jgi:DNA-binding transcriptional LysR family regulator
MNLADLRAFIAVVETGSINRAAICLNLTQPAVTRRVQNFEASLGGKALLDRSSKPPKLTPAGRQALEYCRRILATVEELERNASDSSEPAGELRIGMTHGLAEIVVSAPLDELRRRFPNLQLRVSTQWTVWLTEQVRNGGLDCAVTLFSEHQPLPPRLRPASLGSERIVVVAKRDLKVPQKGGRLRIKDLGTHGWILNTAGCGYRQALQHAFDRAQTSMRISGEILGYDLQLSLIARGAGLGLVPERRLNRSPHRGHLRILPIDDFALTANAVMLRSPFLGTLSAPVDQLQTTIARMLDHYK